MKIAIPIIEKNETSQMSDRFGRSSYYLIYDSESSEIEIIDNPAVQARGGAGIQAVQFLISQDVKAVIAPEVGPNAFKVLRGSNTRIYKGIKTSAKELIEKWKNNELDEI
ncbi:MAG: NifB/NifX family molybdenum-iron cluster-binding protein [Candidatus Thorarchaeota archaeon]